MIETMESLGYFLTRYLTIPALIFVVVFWLLYRAGKRRKEEEK